MSTTNPMQLRTAAKVALDAIEALARAPEQATTMEKLNRAMILLRSALRTEVH